MKSFFIAILMGLSLVACGKFETSQNDQKLKSNLPNTEVTNQSLIFNGAVNYAHRSKGAIVIGSEFSSKFPLSSINDGISSGINWGSGGGWNSKDLVDSQPYIDVKFREPINIESIVLYTLADNFASDPNQPNLTFTSWGLTSYKIYSLKDGAMTLIGNVSGNSQVKSVVNSFAGNVSSIRILFTGTKSANVPGLAFARVTELEVYGYPVTNQSTQIQSQNNYANGEYFSAGIVNEYNANTHNLINSSATFSHLNPNAIPIDDRNISVGEVAGIIRDAISAGYNCKLFEDNVVAGNTQFTSQTYFCWPASKVIIVKADYNNLTDYRHAIMHYEANQFVCNQERELPALGTVRECYKNPLAYLE